SWFQDVSIFRVFQLSCQSERFKTASFLKLFEQCLLFTFPRHDLLEIFVMCRQLGSTDAFFITGLNRLKKLDNRYDLSALPVCIERIPISIILFYSPHTHINQK